MVLPAYNHVPVSLCPRLHRWGASPLLHNPASGGPRGPSRAPKLRHLAPSHASWHLMTRHVAARCALILAVGAVSPPAVGAQDFAQLAHDFVYTTLSFAPSSATQTGLHEYTDPRTGERLQLDEQLDDFSPAALAHEQGFYRDFLRRLHQISRDRLDPQTQADYDLLQDAAEIGLFSLDEEEFTRSKPQLYAETLGSALFSNISLEYADRAARAAHLAARLERGPAYLGQAIANLKGSNAVYRRGGGGGGRAGPHPIASGGGGVVRGPPPPPPLARAAA